MRVLLVDDEPGILEQAEIFLKRENEYFDIETTASPEKALDYIDEKNYDVVVSDYQMPGKDGLELLQEIRDAGADAPFIIFTGRGRESVAMKALNLGANHYLQKSGEPSSQYKTLSRMIENVVSYKKAERMKKFLHTLLRQDLRSKNQLISGYLELFDDTDLTEEEANRLEKAKNETEKVLEIIEDIKELKEIYENENLNKQRIKKAWENIVEELDNMIDEEFDLTLEQQDETVEVLGDYSIIKLFTNLLTSRIRAHGADNIGVFIESDDEEVLIKIVDDGGKPPEEIEELFSGEVYTGRTAGAGGIRYSIAAMIAQRNHGKIEVKDPNSDRMRFDVHLQKA